MCVVTCTGCYHQNRLVGCSFVTPALLMVVFMVVLVLSVLPIGVVLVQYSWLALLVVSLVVCLIVLFVVLGNILVVHVHCLVNLACTGCPRLGCWCGCTGDCTTRVSCLWAVNSSFHRVVFIYRGVVLLAVNILNMTIVDCPVNSACTGCTGCPRPASVSLWPGATIPRHLDNRSS